MTWWWLEERAERRAVERRKRRKRQKHDRLTEAAVRDIRRRGGRNPQGNPRLAIGYSYAELAEEHGVSKSLIAQILTGRAYVGVGEIEGEDDRTDLPDHPAVRVPARRARVPLARHPQGRRRA